MFSNLAKLFRYRGLIQSLVARELKRATADRSSAFSGRSSTRCSCCRSTRSSSLWCCRTRIRLPSHCAVFMFCGILPWNWFSSSLMEASGSLVSGGNLIKKVLFPAEILPIVNVLANMVHYFLGLLILVAFLVGYRHWPDPLGLLWFPVVVVVKLIFQGLALFLSALTVHYRDIRDLLSNLLMFWFFATPIIYPWQDDKRCASTSGSST